MFGRKKRALEGIEQHLGELVILGKEQARVGERIAAALEAVADHIGEQSKAYRASMAQAQAFDPSKLVSGVMSQLTQMNGADDED